MFDPQLPPNQVPIDLLLIGRVVVVVTPLLASYTFQSIFALLLPPGRRSSCAVSNDGGVDEGTLHSRLSRSQRQIVHPSLMYAFWYASRLPIRILGKAGRWLWTSCDVCEMGGRKRMTETTQCVEKKASHKSPRLGGKQFACGTRSQNSLVGAGIGGETMWAHGIRRRS